MKSGSLKLENRTLHPERPVTREAGAPRMVRVSEDTRPARGTRQGDFTPAQAGERLMSYLLFFFSSFASFFSLAVFWGFFFSSFFVSRLFTMGASSLRDISLSQLTNTCLLLQYYSVAKTKSHASGGEVKGAGHRSLGRRYFGKQRSGQEDKSQFARNFNALHTQTKGV